MMFAVALEIRRHRRTAASAAASPPNPPPPPPLTAIVRVELPHLVLELLARLRLRAASSAASPANCAAAFLPASDVASPKRSSIVAGHHVAGGLLRQHHHLHAVGQLGCATRALSILAGVGSKVSPRVIVTVLL